MCFVIIPIFFTQDPGYLKEESENTVVIIGVLKNLSINGDKNIEANPAEKTKQQTA